MRSACSSCRVHILAMPNYFYQDLEKMEVSLSERDDVVGHDIAHCNSVFTESNYCVLIVLFMGSSNKMKHKQWQGKTG